MKFLVWVSLLICLLAGPVVAMEHAEEYEQFAYELWAAVSDGNYEFINDHSDMDVFLAEVTRDCSDRTGEVGKFCEGFEEGLGKRGLSEIVGNTIGEYSTFDLLRVHEVDGRPYALFRINGDNGFNYHDFVLKRTSDGQILIVDDYIYMAGEYVTATMREVFNQTLASQQGVVNKVLGRDRKYLESLSELREIANLVRSGLYEEANGRFVDLPDDFRRQKSFMIMHVTIAARLSDELYFEAMEAFGEQYPEDPAWLLMAIDFEYLREDYDAVIMTLDKLNRHLGGDPLLVAMKANALAAKGDYRRAKKYALAAREAEPGLEESYWSLISIAIVEEDFQIIADELEALKAVFGYEFDPEVLAVDEFYSDFCMSEIGQAWAAAQ